MSIMAVGTVLFFASFIWLVAAAKEKDKRAGNFGINITLLLTSIANLNKTWMPLLLGFVGLGLIIFTALADSHK